MVVAHEIFDLMLPHLRCIKSIMSKAENQRGRTRPAEVYSDEEDKKAEKVEKVDVK
jgi:hypothetical protein